MGLEAELVRHEGWMMRLAMRLVGEENGARDLVQDAFLRVLANPPRPGAPLRGWIWKTLYRLGIDEARRSKAGDLDEDGREAGSTLDAVTILDSRRVLASEIMALPALQRDVICLVYQEGLSKAATARRLECSESRVRRAHDLAMDHLRERLWQRYGGDWPLALAPLLWAWKPAKKAALALLAVLGLSGVAGLALALGAGSEPEDERASALEALRPVYAPAGLASTPTTPPGLELPDRAPIAPAHLTGSQAAQAALSDARRVTARLSLAGEAPEGWTAFAFDPVAWRRIGDEEPLDPNGWEGSAAAAQAREVWLSSPDRALQVILRVPPGSDDLDLGHLDLDLAPATIEGVPPGSVLSMTIEGATVLCDVPDSGRVPLAPLGSLTVLVPGESWHPSTWPAAGYVTTDGTDRPARITR